MTKGSVTQVVTHSDSSRQIGIEAEKLGDSAANRLNVLNVFHSCADMVVVDIKEDLSFVL